VSQCFALLCIENNSFLFVTKICFIPSSVSDPDPHGSAFNWSPGSGSGSRGVKKS
jgi:hypothetical protein